MSACIDPFVGKILASWRYDITGLAPEMSVDYEAHLAKCAYCHGRQRLHRGIDLALIGLATVSTIVFIFAFAVIYHFSPPNALLFEIGALGGFGFSVVVWLIVAVSTPAPLVAKDAVKDARDAVKDAAMSGVRTLHDRLPDNLRERLPEELRVRITGEH
jgi:hypothetical protein